MRFVVRLALKTCETAGKRTARRFAAGSYIVKGPCSKHGWNSKNPRVSRVVNELLNMCVLTGWAFARRKGEGNVQGMMALLQGIKLIVLSSQLHKRLYNTTIYTYIYVFRALFRRNIYTRALYVHYVLYLCAIYCTKYYHYLGVGT